VKNLAGQTARATDEIQKQIASIQLETERAVAAIGGISETISEINGITAGVASSVDQQRSATGEIARNAEEAAIGTNQVSDNIAVVTRSAEQTGGAANEVLGATRNLLTQSTLLRQRIYGFLQVVKAA
jgi:methyl-accepting chemotaxis protein